MNKPALVILGGSVTALAMARNASQLGYTVSLVEKRDDIAMHTNTGSVKILADKSNAEILQAIVSLGEGGGNYLIACSDDWLRFIVMWRSELDNAYRSVLHPPNSTLSICLDKAQLSAWCLENNVNTPRQYLAETTNPTVDASFDYPVFVRPMESLPANGDLPKAIEVDSAGQFGKLIARFQECGVTAVITESLLAHELIQYSVGLARDGDRMVSFVARKTRPLPAQCAVGSFVELSPNAEIEVIARRIANALDYYGIAEIEILYSQDTKQSYLIEINARPWLQYTLALRSGHDLLAFLLEPQRYEKQKEKKVGVYWLDFLDDFFNCFSGSIGLVRYGHVGWGVYLGSLLRANAYPKLSIRDPGPAWYALKLWLKKIFGSR